MGPARTVILVATCGVCGQEQVEISMTIDGARLVMRACSTCDHRSWHRGGDELDLDGVLADISSRAVRYQRTPPN